MQDQDLISAFLANRGVTSCKAGARTLTDRQLKLACGYEPSKLYVYKCELIGEDGMEFVTTERGSSLSDVQFLLSSEYPEARVVHIQQV